MTVAELIEKLKTLPQDYIVVFESGDGFGSAYTAYVDDVVAHDKNQQVELIEI